MSSDSSPNAAIGIAALTGAAIAGAAVAVLALRFAGAKPSRFSIGDQVKRFEYQKRTNDARALDIGRFYDASKLKGKKVLVTGANRGLGLALTKELVSAGARVVATCRRRGNAFDGIDVAQVIEGVDVTSDDSMAALVKELTAGTVGTIDVLINNAGYFYEPVERVTDGTVNLAEDSKMIEICAVGVLRVSSTLITEDLLSKNGKIAIITSQAGSLEWRKDQNPHGDNYGHHMSRAACNMMGLLLSYELKEQNVPVALLHPGFNRTEMTQKYAKIWDKEGAVQPAIGAKRVLHEINMLSMATSGKYINCEDGLEIPW